MIQIYANNDLLETKEHIFGGGERHVQMIEWPTDKNSKIKIVLSFEQDGDIVALANYADAIRRLGFWNIDLFIPYFPGARQDRVCNDGESLSVKVYADLINAMNFDSVHVFDPHSDVVGAVLDNAVLHDNISFVESCISEIKGGGDDIVLISPDAGSNKKIYNVAKALGGKYPVVRADKLRDVSNGKIIETIIYAQDLDGKTCVIIDDIASKSGTFMALAVKLKEMGAKKVILVVSHYEGVADIRKMQESGIVGVYTTNSKLWDINDYNKSGFIKCFDIQKYM